MGGLMVLDQDEARVAHYHTEPRPLSVRSFNCLWNLLRETGQPVTPGNVAKLTARELLSYPNFGRVSLQDVKEWLAGYGLCLQGDLVPIAKLRGSMAKLADALDVLHA
jgi:DNA-directed RNA polymerase alpha subunit